MYSVLSLLNPYKEKKSFLAEVHLMSFPLREAETLARETFKHLPNTKRDRGKTTEKVTPNTEAARYSHGRVTVTNVTSWLWRNTAASLADAREVVSLPLTPSVTCGDTANRQLVYPVDRLAVGKKHIKTLTCLWFNQSHHEQDQTEENQGEFSRFS